MFEVNRVFHLTHVVDDHDATLSFYDDVFGARPHGGKRTGPGGATITLLVVSDLVISPTTPQPGGAPAPLAFRRRFGEHLHSIAWYVDDPVDLVRTLEERGLALKDEAGRPLVGVKHEIWTPARRTPALLEFIGLDLGTLAKEDPRFAPDWTPRYWAEEHPLGIVGTACLTAATNDLTAGTEFFTQALHGKVINRIDRTAYDTRSTMIAVGPYTVVEVAEPLDTQCRAARDIAHCGGDMLHACTFQVADVERAAEYLSGKGLRVERPAAGHIVLDPAGSHGILFRFTDRAVTDW